MKIGPVKRHFNSLSGFTLTELMVVLFLGAVVIVLAAHTWTTWREGYKFNSFVRGTITALKTARARAIAAQKPVQLVFQRKTIKGYTPYSLEGGGWYKLGADGKIGTSDDSAWVEGTDDDSLRGYFKMTYFYSDEKPDGNNFLYTVDVTIPTTWPDWVAFDARGFAVKDDPTVKGSYELKVSYYSTTAPQTPVNLQVTTLGRVTINE